MKKILLFCAVFTAVAAIAVELTSDGNGKIILTQNQQNFLVNDSVTLQNDQWQTLINLTKDSPQREDKDGKSIVTWTQNNCKVVRTAGTLTNGKIKVMWDISLPPGISGGKYLELSLMAPRNSWQQLPDSGKRLLAETDSVLEVTPDSGKLYWDFRNSSQKWQWEDLRNSNWYGHLRLLFFGMYDRNKENLFHAEITIGTEAVAGVELNKGNGDEYARVVIAPEAADAPAELPAALDIAPDQVLRQHSPRLLGFNNDWQGFVDLKPVDPAKAKPETAVNPADQQFFNVLAGVPLPLIRVSGTDSQTFQWQWSIGPNSERTAYSLQTGAKGGSICYYGLLEHFQTFLKLNPNIEFVYVVNLTRTTPEDTRNLAEFLTGSANTRYGALRCSYGMPQPVKIAIWELGNEMDLGGRQHQELDEYIDNCRKHLAAIRSVEPKAVFAAHAVSSPWDPSRSVNWQNYHRKILQELGGDLGFVVFHPYYRGMAPKDLLGYLNTIRDDIARSAHPQIKIYNSEHAKWPPGYQNGPAEWRKNWYQTHALVGVLDTAEWLILMMQRPEIGAQTYHAFSSGPWGLVYRIKGQPNQWYTTGIAELFTLFGEIPAGADIIKSTLSGNGTNVYAEKYTLSAVAASLGHGRELLILVNNRLPGTTRKLTLEKGFDRYRLESIKILTADNLNAVNNATARPIHIETPDVTDSKTVMIAPKSLTLLRFVRR